MKDSSFFPIERNRYFYGKLLTVRDFDAEQTYARIKHRLHNRLVHGAGVVCGLGVSSSDDATLIIESGMALDYLGREIVIEEPLIRKLEMIEGQEKLRGRDEIFLCLGYDETDTESVNAVGSDTESQFNMTREGYKLFFSDEPPQYRALLEAKGYENVNVIYTSGTLTLVMSAPKAVCAGDEFEVSMLLVKNDKTLPVHFTLDGENGFIESESGRLHIEYNESQEQARNVVEASFRFRAQSLSGVEAQLFPSGAELNVTLGSHKYKNFITINASMFLCANIQQLKDRYHAQDDLRKHLLGRELPIYLAKLELVSAMERAFLGSITNLPFGQAISLAGADQAKGFDRFDVRTSVRPLEFWQMPDVKASFDKGGDLYLDFGIPTPELYDYTTSHGVVDIPMPGGIKVNARYFSDEVPHGLGPGNVDVRLAAEFDNEANGQGHLFGNSEVFRSKSAKIDPPWLEAAAVVYPERGTLRIGVWLHDDAPGNLVRVHYYAQKPERDTKRLMEKRKISIAVIPEVSRLGKREQTRFKASVSGAEDKGVVWSVKDESGGAIDANGSYQAPESQGTYEIVAAARADESVTASAFVIVE